MTIQGPHDSILTHYRLTSRKEKVPSGNFQDVLKKLMDKDGDGNISSKEMKSLEKKYGNGDGLLTKDELKAGLLGGLGKKNPRTKKYGSGITENDVDKALNKLDKNEDEIITKKEMRNYTKGGDYKKGKGGHNNKDYGDIIEGDVDKALDKLDKNNDGIITKREAQQFVYAGKLDKYLKSFKQKDDGKWKKLYTNLTENDIDKALDKLDRNNNEVITQREMQHFINARKIDKYKESLKPKHGHKPDKGHEKIGNASDFIWGLIDKNGDGKATSKEMKEFEKKYGDGDGLLTKGELKAGIMAELNKLKTPNDASGDASDFIRDLIDKNGDGKATSKEMKEFEKKYGDGDGLLTKDELKAGIMAELGKQKTDHSDKSGDLDWAAGPPAAGFIQDLLDKNDDGKVTSAEMKALEKKYGNGDGLLTKDELKAGVKAELAKQKDKTTSNGIERVLNEIDANEDEIITVNELRKLMNPSA